MAGSASLSWELQGELKRLERSHSYRRRRVVDDRDSARPLEVSVEGQHCINFCSNDYLGLSHHPEMVAAFKHAADRYGVGSGSAHLVTGHTREHHALEEELADFLERPRALLFSTGYMANLGIAAALLGRGDLAVQDKLNHASLLDAARLCGARLLRYQHVDTGALETRLAGASGKRTMVFTDGVFSMDGDIAPLEEISELCARHRALLVVDDAHGMGVLGGGGRGTGEHLGLPPSDIPLLMVTLGKALGSFGAAVAGDADMIETLIQRARTYIYTTAPPPPVAAATRAALRLVRDEPWRRQALNQRIEQFRQGASQLGLKLMPSRTAIQPLLLGTPSGALDASTRLMEKGLWVTAIRPPTVPVGTARLRITLSAAHTAAHVERLLDALETLSPSLS